MRLPRRQAERPGGAQRDPGARRSPRRVGPQSCWSPGCGRRGRAAAGAGSRSRRPTAARRRGRAASYAGARRCRRRACWPSPGRPGPGPTGSRSTVTPSGRGRQQHVEPDHEQDDQHPQPHRADRRAQHDRHQPQQEQQRDPPGDRHRPVGGLARDRDGAERGGEHGARRRRPRARPRAAATAGGRRVAWASALTSSGVTKSRPDSQAQARAVRMQRDRAARADAEPERRCLPRRSGDVDDVAGDLGGDLHRRAPRGVRPRCRRRRRPAVTPDRGHVVRVEAGGVAADDLELLGALRHRQHHLEQEAVELGLGQRVGALVLDRVLGRGDQERPGQRRARRRPPRPGPPPSPRAAPTGSWAGCG